MRAKAVAYMDSCISLELSCFEVVLLLVSLLFWSDFLRSGGRAVPHLSIQVNVAGFALAFGRMGGVEHSCLSHSEGDMWLH